MTAIAPLVGHADELDALLHAGLGMCEEMQSPVLSMYARILGACGLRTRNRSGDRDRAAGIIDEAVVIGDRIGAGFALAAAEHFPALCA